MKSETFNKIAKITLLFWFMKILATTLGETFGDYISQTLNLGYYVGLAVTATIFLVALLLKLNAKKYVPWIF